MPTVTVTGGVIFDADRALGVQHDGLSADSSAGIWEATTNLLINGGFETNTTGWVLFAAGTMARSTVQFKFGAASLLCTTTAAVNDGIVSAQMTLTLDSYTASAWVYSSITQDYEIQLTDETTQNLGTVTSVPANTWTKIITSGVLTGLDTRKVRVLQKGSAATTFYIDGVQVEQQPLATPYVHTDGATATRNAARAQCPASLLDETQGWVAARMRMDWVNTSDPSGNPAVFDWRDDANNLIQIRYDTTANTWELQRRATAGTGEVTLADTFALADAVTVIAAWDASNLKISVDGSVFTSVAATNIPTLAAVNCDIGSVAGTSEHIDSDVLWLACGIGILSDADAVTIHANGNTDPSSMPGNRTMIWPASTSTYTDTFGSTTTTPRRVSVGVGLGIG